MAAMFYYYLTILGILLPPEIFPPEQGISASKLCAELPHPVQL